MGRLGQIDVNDGKHTLLYEDFKIVRRAKIGDIVTLSDGKRYRIVDNETRMSKQIGKDYA